MKEKFKELLLDVKVIYHTKMEALMDTLTLKCETNSQKHRKEANSNYYKRYHKTRKD